MFTSFRHLSVCLVVFIIAAESACADVVVMGGSGQDGGSEVRKTGEVVDYTGKELLLKSIGGSVAAIPANRVIRVETEWTPQHTEADRLFAREEFSEALSHYRQALSVDQRDWVRRQILAEITWCLQSLGEFARAGETFLLVLQSDPTTMHLDAMPLAWTAREPGLALRQKAEEWIRDEKRSAARLMGASWLLNSARRRNAGDALDFLTTDSDSRVALLATAQRWRGKLVTATDDELDRWPTVIERLPQSLRAGPYYVYGQALARRDRHEHAVLAMLRVPILFPRQRVLSATALMTAGRQLEKMKRREEAGELYRELVDKYADFPLAAEAEKQLKDE